MASNYFPVSLLEQPWDDDPLGTLSSLERRRRKIEEHRDVNAFYKFLGVVFVSFSLVLLASELYTFATEPSRGLTGAFLLEIGRMSGVAYGQLQNLYKAVGDVAWTGLAVVHGHDFAQRGVSITDGAAQLLASGLYYLALALSVLIMYYAYPGVARAPLRTAALSTIAAGAMFGAPPLYAWLVSRLFQTRSPEPVVLVALLFAAVMCSASFSVARAISGRRGDGPHPQPGVARHRNVAAPRRQAAPGTGTGGGASGGGGGGSAGTASLGASGGSGGAAAPAAGGQKRSLYSRASSSGRSGSAAAPGDGTQPSSVARSGSSASLTGHGLLAGFACLSSSTPSVAAAADPVGIHASARGLHGIAGGNAGGGGANRGSNSSLDLASSSAASCPSGKQGSAAAGNNRGGPMGHSGSAPSAAFDPVAPSDKLSGNSTTSRGTAPAGPAASAFGNSSGSGGASAAAKASANANSKQRQQVGGGGGGADGGKAKHNAPAGSASAFNQARTPVLDPVSNSSGPGGGRTSGGLQSGTGKQKQQQQHSDPVAVPPASATATAAVSSSLSASSAAAGASKKKASDNASNGSSSSVGSAPAAAASGRVLATAAPATASARTQQGTGSAAASGHAAAGGSNAASKPARMEATVPLGPASQGKGVQANVGSVAGSAAAAAVASAGGATISGTGGLLSRLAGSVASVASAATTAAPVLSNRAAKKAAAAAGTRKPQGQHSPPQPQYIIVPPPPPPPRKSQPAAGDAAVAASGGGSAAAGSVVAGAASAASGTAGAPVRNAWLNPNPVIKIASGVAKGPKGAAAAARVPVHGPVTPAAAPAAVPAASATATVPMSRSSGGGAAHFGSASPPTPSSARSASYGGAGFGGAGINPADPPVSGSYVSGGSPHTYPRHALFAAADATASIGAAPPLGGGGAIGDPVAAADVATGVPANAFLPPLAQEHFRSHFSREDTGAGDHGYITTTIVSADATMGPLIAHKHASGDLDIANVAANYRPYPSSVLQSAAPALDAESADSFSLFSTPPPLITAEAAAINPGVAAATACLAAADADVDGAPRVAAAHQMPYGSYGGYGTYAALPSLSGDPVWSHNVPSVFGPPAGIGNGGVRAPRVPPPGFPSHAYGGAFAAGPIPGGGGWEQPAAAVAAAATAASAAANGRPDAAGVPPLPPAGENGVLASLGFVDDGGADSSSNASAGGAGDEAGASCAICWSAPRQVGFLHGKTSHLCVCRRCAAKLREGVHRCPMCRQLIERIIDIY